jgi:hypothetical protein
VGPFRLPLWPRLSDLVPEVILLGGLAVFLVDEPDAATSALKSTKAVLLMAGVGVAWLVARFVVARLVPVGTVRVALFGAAAVAILAVVVLPAYREHTVVEAMPGRGPAPGSPGAGSPSSGGGAAPAPTDPIAQRSASLRGVDHRASGTVTLYRRPAGGWVVGLEDFDVQPGPDYDVYVVSGADRKDRDGGIRLDDLRGNRGTQFYDVPAGADLGRGPWTVLIWCQTFAVPVAHATPA